MTDPLPPQGLPASDQAHLDERFPDHVVSADGGRSGEDASEEPVDRARRVGLPAAPGPDEAESEGGPCEQGRVPTMHEINREIRVWENCGEFLP